MVVMSVENTQSIGIVNATNEVSKQEAKKNGNMVVMSAENTQPIGTVNATNDVSKQEAKKKGNVTQRNYVMNDLGALRKKLKHEGRKNDFIISKEAKDGSNTIVQMKASFFDFTKAKFIDDILKHAEVDGIQNAEAAKATTETSGDAYVEYSMDVTFRVKDKVHTTKLTAYTTTCQLMFQPAGEQSGIKSHLGSRGSPRYFVDHFLIPWCEKAVESKEYNDKISVYYIEALNDEIRRMETSKIEAKKSRKNTVSGEITNAKCASKGCSFQGLNPNNKSAVGVCAKKMAIFNILLALKSSQNIRMTL